MRSFLASLTLTALLSVLLGLGFGGHARGAAPLPADKVDAYVQEQMKRVRIPGVALAIVQGDQITHAKGFGVADSGGRAVTPETPFIIGSVSKSFTALAIMQLVEAGKVDLDAPVQHYLPWFDVADPGAAAHLTVRQLLTHTTGISMTASWGLSVDEQSTMESVVRQLKDVHLTAPPGSAAFDYSNVNYTTLGLIVQVASGQTYEEYVQTHIFDAIGMKRSFTTEGPAVAAGLSEGHQYLLGFPFAVSYPRHQSQLAAGYLISTADDMGRYLITLMQGGRIDKSTVLSAAGVKVLQAPSIQVTPEHSYGMGWHQGPMAGVQVVDHNGETENFQSHVVIAADKSWGVVVLANSNNTLGSGFEELVEGVVSLLAGKEPPAPPRLSAGTLTVAIGWLLALVVLWQLWSLRRVKRWFDASRRERGVWLRIVANLALGLLLWLGIPILMKLNWSTLTMFVPDLSYLIRAVASLSLLAGVCRILARLGRARTRAA